MPKWNLPPGNPNDPTQLVEIGLQLPTIPSASETKGDTLPLAQALANAQQEERPGSSSMSLVAYLNRRIASLERRMSDLEQ